MRPMIWIISRITDLRVPFAKGRESAPFLRLIQEVPRWMQLSKVSSGVRAGWALKPNFSATSVSVSVWGYNQASVSAGADCRVGVLDTNFTHVNGVHPLLFVPYNLMNDVGVHLILATS